MDSDDSDFYGDADTLAYFDKRVQRFDPHAWIERHRAQPGRPRKQGSFRTDLSNLHNPYAGVHYAWQLTETVDAFLHRLPPSTTPQADDTPWIFICNPYIPRLTKFEAENQAVKGSEDEGPEQEGTKTRLVTAGGIERLQLMSRFMDEIKPTAPGKSTVQRDIAKERQKTVDDILRLAHAGKVRAGKWMLFCTPTEVDDVWAVVARATANNELGIAAKVAPHQETEDARKDRLVCVYTTDFQDKADVARVLQKLRELRLVEVRGRPIYYKPDVFTYIGIASGNKWGIRSSIYNSKYL